MNHDFAAAFEALKSHPESGVRTLAQLSGPPRQQIPNALSLDEAVLRIVISQLLSTKAAATIKARLLEQFKSVDGVFLALDKLDGLKPAHGLSASKIRSLKHYAASEIRAAGIPADISYDELKSLLKPLKGFGPWSIDMLAIFFLALPDVWPMGDLIVRKTALHFWPGGEPPVSPNLLTVLALCCWQAKHNGFVPAQPG